MLAGCGRQKQSSAHRRPTHNEIQAKAVADKCFDTKPLGKDASYLYAPGLMATELMMGRYCPQFVASTGENVTWRTAGHTIGQPHSSVVFSEIDLRKPGYFTLNPIAMIINGVRKDLTGLMRRYWQERYNFSVDIDPKGKRSIIDYGINFGDANIGQGADIHRLKKAYKKHVKKHADSDVILYGDSRGAATIFNFIALHNPSEVKAAVLEGIFDDVSHLMKHLIYDDKEPRAERRLMTLNSWIMGEYDRNGQCPRMSVEKIADEIPLLFVTSLKDGLCNPQGPFYLYKRLKERGHKNVHILVLKKAWHPCYMLDDADDKNAYESVVHAFYRHYKLPHNADKAAVGAEVFRATQPSYEQLKALHPVGMCTLCK